MSGPVSSAFISEAISRITSLLTGKYSEHNNVQEWIDRLVMARILIESTLLESEEFDINNDEPLHKWQEKFKEALCESKEVLSNFPEILHEEPSQTIEGGHTASNLGEAVTRQVDLEANLPHDPFMQEEGSDDATLVHTASNLMEAVTRQVDQQANLPHDPLMQEQGSDDATLVHTASNLTEAVTRQVDLQANLPHDQPMQEEGSDGATLVHPSLNLLKVVIRQFELEAILPYYPFRVQGKGMLASLVYTASNLMEAVIHRLNQQANLPHDPLMQEEGSDDSTLVHPALNFKMSVKFKLLELMRKLRFSLDVLWQLMPNLIYKPRNQCLIVLDDVFSPLKEGECSIATALKNGLIRWTYPSKKWLGEYLENDEKVSKLIKTVEKLEKMAGNIGNFIKLLEMQKRRKMNRKRKRSGVALEGFFLVLSLKLQTYALFCYREDPYLHVIMLFRANCDIPTGITSDIFIGFIM